MHKKPLTGIVESLERLDGGYDVVTTSYMGQRIIIPLNEMGILVNSNENETDEDINIRKAKLANGMLGPPQRHARYIITLFLQNVNAFLQITSC